MDRSTFQALSNLRRVEASALIRAGHYAGGYYLLGYAVECAFKACICKKTVRHSFPPREADKLYSHKLEDLRRLAGLQAQMQADINANAALGVNWAIVRDWTEQSRYDLTMGRAAAEDLYSACTARTNGVLRWIKNRW